MTEPKRMTPVAGRVHPTSARPSRDPATPAAEGKRGRASTTSKVDRALVIRSKIQPPPLRSSTLSRQRLLERLNDAVGSRLTLVVAEAGYGKTTLLADFSSRASVRCLWYKLDPTDADPVTWTNYVIAAAREVDPDFGEATLSLLAQVAPGGPPESAFVASLLGELPRLGEAPTVLVLDDFHAVDDSSEARDFLARLIKDAPPWLHFVISSRRRPVLELARLAGMGEVVEITTDELRFVGDETERLFADGYGLVLDADVLRDVETRTQGWAASLQLFHGSVRGKSSSAVRALAKSLSGASNPIYDFLAQEVLNNLPDDLEDFLVRVALLDRIVAPHVVALFSERRGLAPSLEEARRWIDESDRLGLLSRASQQSDARHLHPLLRDFLIRTLSQRHSAESISQMHLGLARAVAGTEPLLASRHYIEAGEKAEAMRCLGRSVMLTMGSGQWGMASSLIDRLGGVPADPAVAAIRARRLIEEGDLPGAADLLAGVDITDAPPDVRAVFRYSDLSLGWRLGDRPKLFASLAEIQADKETPRVLMDIAQVFIDASPLSSVQLSFPALVRRLEEMARSQLASGHSYYAAISLHNAAIAESVAGNHSDAIRIAERALETFDRLAYPASELYSTHAVLAGCWYELGNSVRAEQHIQLGLASGGEHGDVPAGFAYQCARVGERERAERLLASADALERQGLSDLEGAGISTNARAFLQLATNPTRASELLHQQPRERPLDIGGTLEYDTMVALSALLAGDTSTARTTALPAHERAQQQGARSAEVRLALLTSVISGGGEPLAAAIADAASVGELALLEVADALGQALHTLTPIPRELHESISRWPRRWLPILRSQLARGNVPTARAAALLLDEHGDPGDVVRLRAFAKTYSRRGRVNSTLGRNLAKAVGPKLYIHDLGRVRLRIGDRSVDLSTSRRKPASLLMYLVTRPNLTATREQILDELWPDTDPASASNSLNQSLYFLRRDIDPWYEDDVSVEYVPFEGDLVWLDEDLVRSSSVEFLKSVRGAKARSLETAETLLLMDSYVGHFAPEFEYEEWATAWRSRVHAAFLEFAHSLISRMITLGALGDARDIAVRAFEADPDARDVERALIALYWRLGARSAARAQYAHFAGQERADGVEAQSLAEICDEVLAPAE